MNAKQKKPFDRQTAMFELGKIRSRIAQIKEAQAGFEYAVRPKERALSALDAWISRKVEEARAQGDFLFFADPKDREFDPMPYRDSPELNVLSFLCGMFPEQIRDLFAARIDKAYECVNVLDPEAQKALADELGVLEPKEEAIIRAAADAGIHLPRRGDVNPEVVLAP
ncbi:MAG: hypothetical protein DI597_05370 [Pseudoxanthomonas spadix]|nr:MAG: hypothetical protein DI597_05370 [Pseudoxanthomonas spadix]